MLWLECSGIVIPCCLLFVVDDRMSPMLAMEWLLQHEGDADIDEPLVLGARAGKTRRKRKEFVPNPRVCFPQ